MVGMRNPQPVEEVFMSLTGNEIASMETGHEGSDQHDKKPGRQKGRVSM